MKCAPYALIAAYVLLTSCKDEERGTQVMVVIDAESSVRSRIFDVDVVVKSGGGDGDAASWTTRYEMSLTQGSGEVQWPLELALVPRDDDARRNYLVIATARGESGGILAQVRAISGYVEGASLSLPLVFDAGCLARNMLCDGLQTCRAGRCMDPFVEPSTLLPFQPGIRPGEQSSQAGDGSGGTGDTGGTSGVSGTAGVSGTESDASVPAADGAVSECPDGTAPPCEIEPMITCDDERCAGCPESFLRVADDRCTPLLVGLGLSRGSLSPPLSTDDVRYDIAVPLLTDAVTIAPAVPEGVTVEINGNELDLAARAYTATNLPIGETTLVMTLKAPGHDSRTYTLKLVRSGGQRSFLKAHNPGADDNFGLAVALQGGTIVVGAPGEDSSTADPEGANDLRSNSGAVYVMVPDGPSYKQSAYLKADPILEGAKFGTAIAIDGDTLVIGAPDEREGGSAYVYRLGAEGWAFEARLTVAGAQTEQRFGAAVALRGDELAVGAPGDDTFHQDAGAVYVYTRSGTSWTRSGPLGPAIAAPLIWTGSSVALHGDRLYAGATGESSDVYPRGAVYVFAKSGEGYVEEQKITEADVGPLDFFGESVAVDGDTLAIGAFGGSGSSAGNGLVYIYTRGSEGWELQQRLGASNPSTDAHFGLRLALFGDTLVTGAPDDDSGGSGIDGILSAPGRTDSGAGYVLKRSGSTWTQLTMIKAEPPEAGDRYGYSVAANADTLVFGAPEESSTAMGVDGDALMNGASKSGAVYVVR